MEDGVVEYRDGAEGCCLCQVTEAAGACAAAEELADDLEVDFCGQVRDWAVAVFAL